MTICWRATGAEYRRRQGSRRLLSDSTNVLHRVHVRDSIFDDRSLKRMRSVGRQSPIADIRRVPSIVGRRKNTLMSPPLSSAVCPGCSQPLPAELASGPQQLQCFQCGTVFPNPLRPANTHGTYGEQFRERPVSTYFFGPQLDAYQSHVNPHSLADRRAQYRIWLFVLLGTLGIAVVLPFLIGLVRAGILMAVSAAGYCLFFAGIWALAYGIGLYLFGGALFEKARFMNSRRAREKRAIWGDVKTRNLYMNFGRGVMVVAAVISFGNTLLTSAGVLVVGGQASDESGSSRPSGVASAPPEDDRPTPEELTRVRDWEDKVLDERQQLEDVAAEMRSVLDDHEKLKTDSASNPDDIARRKLVDDHERVLAEQFVKYEERVKTWKRRVDRLQGALVETQLSSDVYDRNAALPPELTFAKPTKPSADGQFPTNEVEILERQLTSALEKMSGSQSRGRPLGRMEWHIGALGKLDEYRSRLEQIEQEFGYRSPVLAKLPSREEFAKLKADAELAARRPNPAVIPSGSPAGGPGRDPGGLPGFPAVPGPPGANLMPGARTAGGELLEQFDESRQVLRGDVSVRGVGKLKELSIAAENEGALVSFATPIVEPYVLQTRITRREGQGPLWLILPIGIPAEQRAVALVIDGAEFRTGLEAIAGAALGATKPQPGMPRGQQLSLDSPVFLRCEVSGVRVTLKLGDKMAYHWQGDPKVLSLPDRYGVKDLSQLHIGCQNASFRIELPVVTSGSVVR